MGCASAMAAWGMDMKALLVSAALLLTMSAVAADVKTGGKLEKIAVHGASLEGNLSGDSPDRTVFVYLPPSYASDARRRYPVLYMLHGYSISAQFQIERLGVPESIDRAIASGKVRDMIVVLPDAQTLHNGSMYSSSVTTGDWEGYIARDLVAYVDVHYRTIPARASRGLAGHSMGGYGTLRIGMKYPEVFSSLYAMSSCCLSARGVSPTDAELEKITTVEAATALERGARTTMAAGAAWSPNPQNPPLYLDLPTKDGKPRPDVLARYAANSPHATLPQYVPSLKRYKAIALDVGLQDFLLQDNVEMDQLLTRFGVKHTYETYEGDHVNRVGERFEQHVMPFFSQQLEFAGK
jgi:enterochelin esterase-like enzyme